MYSAKFGIRHVFGGINAYSSGNLASQKKKNGNRKQDIKNGVRNLTVFEPVRCAEDEAEDEEENGEKHSPTRSSCFHFPSTSAIDPVGLGMKKSDPTATGRMTNAKSREEPSPSDIFVLCQGRTASTRR